MSTEKPKKRLVIWEQHLETQCAKGIGHSFGVVFESVGYCCVMGALAAFASCGQGGLVGFLVGLTVGTFFGGLGALTLWASMVVSCNADNIGPVAPITKRNAKYLPEGETLVRGSDRPAADQEAELLRAVRQGPDSQPEQLLRATQERRQDV